MKTIKHRYVRVIPDSILEGELYICEEFGAVVHKCCCGCGSEISTPLSPTDWKLIKNGSVISLYPSIGNWSLPCRSHYWIRNNQVIWDEQWSTAQIAACRDKDRRMKQQYYNKKVTKKPNLIIRIILGIWQALKK